MAGHLGLQGVLFVDSGLAWSAADELRFGRARTGAGAGVQLLVPAVQMARFEIAFDEEAGVRVSLASLSKFDAQRLRLR